MEEVDVRLERMTLADLLRWRISLWAEEAEDAGVRVHHNGAQAAVARVAGIDKGTLNKVVNDHQGLGHESALALSRVLGISPMVLMLLAYQEREEEESDDQQRRRVPASDSSPVPGEPTAPQGGGGQP